MSSLSKENGIMSKTKSLKIKPLLNRVLIQEQEETTETGIAYFAGIETGYYDVLLQDPTLTYEIKKIYFFFTAICKMRTI